MEATTQSTPELQRVINNSPILEENASFNPNEEDQDDDNDEEDQDQDDDNDEEDQDDDDDDDLTNNGSQEKKFDRKKFIIFIMRRENAKDKTVSIFETPTLAKNAGAINRGIAKSISSTGKRNPNGFHVSLNPEHTLRLCAIPRVYLENLLLKDKNDQIDHLLAIIQNERDENERLKEDINQLKIENTDLKINLNFLETELSFQKQEVNKMRNNNEKKNDQTMSETETKEETPPPSVKPKRTQWFF